jgi:hypothetical protein
MQNFKNHSRYVPGYHFVTLFLLLIVLIGAVVNVINSAHENLYSASLLVVLTLATIMGFFYSRSFSLKAQDRAIRAEENLRHFAATGKLLDNRLTIHQVIALRFAPDAEFVELASRAAAENLGTKEIKKAIQEWKADNHRV